MDFKTARSSDSMSIERKSGPPGGKCSAMMRLIEISGIFTTLSIWTLPLLSATLRSASS